MIELQIYTDSLFLLMAWVFSHKEQKGAYLVFPKKDIIEYMTHSQMLGKVESGGGPIFKVVLER